MSVDENIKNWPLIGNEKIKEFLGKSIENDSIGGSYIFAGPENLGKATVAIHFAKVLLCEKERVMACGKCASCKLFNVEDEQERGNSSVNAHGDFHYIQKMSDKKNISVEQVRDLIQDLKMSSFLNSYKVGIIDKAEALSENASNALLKTLEEPNDNTVIILIVSDVELLPKTIASRAKILDFKLVKTSYIFDYLLKSCNSGRDEARDISSMSLGRPAMAIKMYENDKYSLEYKSTVGVFLNFVDQGLDQRVVSVERMFDEKLNNRELVDIVNRVMNVWQGLLRDCLLFDYGFGEFVQNKIFENKIREVCTRFSKGRVVELLKVVDESRRMMSANVNPKACLENIAINI